MRLNPHFHTLFLDGAYGPDGDGQGRMFHPATGPTQADIEHLVTRANRRVLRFLQRRGVITLITAPGDGEVTVVPDETMGEQDPLLARLLAAAPAGAVPAGPATKRQLVRIVLDAADHLVGKGNLCAQSRVFNLQAATRIAANDQPGRERLCRYILRSPLASDRLTLRRRHGPPSRSSGPWQDGTSAVTLDPVAVIDSSRPSCHRRSATPSDTSACCPLTPLPAVSSCPNLPRLRLRMPSTPQSQHASPSTSPGPSYSAEPSPSTSSAESAAAAFACAPEAVTAKILVAMHLPAEAPELHPARPPPGRDGQGDGDGGTLAELIGRSRCGRAGVDCPG